RRNARRQARRPAVGYLAQRGPQACGNRVSRRGVPLNRIHMTRIHMTRRRILWTASAVAGLILAVGVAAVAVLQSSWFYEKLRQQIVATVETATGGRVEIASLRFNWTQLRAEIRSFVVHGTEPAGKPPLFQANSVAVGLKIVSMLRRDVDIQYLEVTDPLVYLIVDREGRTNVPAPKGNT